MLVAIQITKFATIKTKIEVRMSGHFDPNFDQITKMALMIVMEPNRGRG